MRGENAPPPPARIPTLREALLFTRALNWPVNVEIKGHPDHHDRLVRETARLISDLEMHAWVLVSSFHHDVLRRLKSLDPRILTGVLTQETIDDPEALIRAVNADTLHPADGKISEALVRRCQAAGIPLIAWTVNDPERLKQLKAWGVSAVITDRPQALMPMIHP
ncbi:MAG: glycerophosphodiester phosphodiesterase [Desulfosoma sp.]